MAMMNEMEYRTIGKALAGGYRAAVYCRLSKDDDLQRRKCQYRNQRDMLEKYCESRDGRLWQSIRTMASQVLTWSVLIYRGC